MHMHRSICTGASVYMPTCIYASMHLCIYASMHIGNIDYAKLEAYARRAVGAFVPSLASQEIVPNQLSLFDFSGAHAWVPIGS